MSHPISRRAFVATSGAFAAGVVSGAPLLATEMQQGGGVKPGEQLTSGMIDFHVHTAPDTAERTVTAVEAARAARDKGLRAIVLKGTAFETVTRAAAANAEVKGIQVFGGVVFNWSSGGINPAAVEAMVNLRGAGAEKIGRVVWMPSNDSRHHFERFKIERTPVDVFTAGTLVPAMHDVLALCAKHDLVLQTCHLSPREAIALIKEAKAVKVQKIVCTHADYDPINMSVDDQKEAARLGAFIEHAYIGVYLGPNSPAERFRPWRGTTVEQILSAIRAVGVESSILASDMGAAPIGIPADGFATFVLRLRELGMTDAELDRAGRKNPAALLGLP
jgi:Family of unknown function (DUF6282)